MIKGIKKFKPKSQSSREEIAIRNIEYSSYCKDKDDFINKLTKLKDRKKNPLNPYYYELIIKMDFMYTGNMKQIIRLTKEYVYRIIGYKEYLNKIFVVFNVDVMELRKGKDQLYNSIKEDYIELKIKEVREHIENYERDINVRHYGENTQEDRHQMTTYLMEWYLDLLDRVMRNEEIECEENAD